MLHLVGGMAVVFLDCRVVIPAAPVSPRHPVASFHRLEDKSSDWQVSVLLIVNVKGWLYRLYTKSTPAGSGYRPSSFLSFFSILSLYFLLHITPYLLTTVRFR